MISRLDFLFPSGIPDPSTPRYQQMIAEIGREGRWLERLFLIVGVLCLIPVVLFAGGAALDVIRRGRVSTDVLIGLIFLVMAGSFYLFSHSLEVPRRPYRLDAAEYSNYQVVEARVVRLGMISQQRSSRDRHRKVRWRSPPPLAREGWSPRILVSGRPLFGEAVKIPAIVRNDVVYVGLDPSGRLPPLFLGVKRTGR